MNDSSMRFVIGAGLFTIFMVGGVIYLFSAYLSYSLPFQQWVPNAEQSDGQDNTVAISQRTDNSQKSTSQLDQRSFVVTAAPADENNNTRISLPVVQESSESLGQVANKNTALVGDSIVTIKAFKATMFSDLTENATEVAVTQSAQVKVLEHSGSWVKIEVIQGGAIGYVHSSNFGDLNELTQPINSKSASGQKSYRIMALGDSITEGFSGGKSYRSSLSRLLENSFCEYEMVGSRTENKVPTDFSSPHEGYSSHSVDYFLDAVNGNPGIDTTISSYRPNVLLVHVGSVDMYVGQSVDSTVQELDALIAKIWNTGADIEIFMANVIPWYGVSSSNDNVVDDIAALSVAISKWVEAKDNPRLHLVDVSSNYLESYMQPDGIHPNADGDAFLAEIFLNSLRANGICPAITETAIVK